MMLKAAFREHLDLDNVTTEGLFDARDHQNVPKTIKLLQAIYELSLCSTFTSLAINRPVVLLGELLGCLILPYIKPSYTLSEQLTSLSAAVHITLILYRMDATSFITGQLGYDIPTTCKNVFWCVAKQKILKPHGKFHIGQTGSDRLEGDFGHYRTVKGSPNFDLQQLGQHAGATYTLSTVLARETSWNRGSRRLDLDGAEGIDHTNPASWLGDVHVINVSLLTCWNAGKRRATRILTTADVPVNFDLQGPSPDKPIDILHPNGSFVGLREDTLPIMPPTASDSQPALPVNTPVTSDDTETVDIELEDLLPNDEHEDEDAVFKKPSMWLDVKGKSIHKSSAVRFLLSSETGIKSTDRLRRVRGYSRDPAKATLEDDSLLGDNFIVGQLVGTFLRIENLAALAIVRVTVITNPSGISLPSINEDGLNNPNVKLSGQVLQLKPISPEAWEWSNEWELFKKTHTDDVGSKHSAVLSFPATLAQCLSPKLVPNASTVTWQFDNEGLAFICTALWERVKSDPSHIPTKPQTPTFPYRDSDGGISLISDAGSKVLSETLKEGEVGCFMCAKVLQRNKIRDHVAEHILATIHGRAQKELKMPVGSENPCGSCGRSGTCTINIVKKNGTETPQSNCPNFYKFSMKTAAKSTKSGPSTNRPVICYLCQERDGNTKSLPEYIFWSYNLLQHFNDAHPDKVVRDRFLEEIRISTEECMKLGITSAQKRKRGGKDVETPVARSKQKKLA